MVQIQKIQYINSLNVQIEPLNGIEHVRNFSYTLFTRIVTFFQKLSCSKALRDLSMVAAQEKNLNHHTGILAQVDFLEALPSFEY